MANKSSKDIKNNIKRLKSILDKQKESLNSLSLNDPEFENLKKAIEKTRSEISDNDTEYKRVLSAEEKTRSEETLKQAEEDLKYVQASGDPQEILEAQNNVNKARISVTAAQFATSNKQSSSASAAALGLPTSLITKKSPTPATPTPTPTPQANLGATGGGTGGGKDSGDKKKDKLTDAEREDKALGIASGKEFELPEVIFKEPSLKLLLEEYVNTPGMTDNAFIKKLRANTWFRKNSAVIKQRYVQLYNYQDLVDTGQIDPQVPGNTQYEQDIAKIERQLADKARVMGSNLASDPDNIKLIAQNMYLTNQGIDDPMTVDLIAAAIGTIGGTIGGKPTGGYSGEALEDYQQLQSIAKANGFSMAEIIPGGASERQVLEGIATGRMDVNFIAQSARRLATQGQPQYVRDLLGQGYNLDQVYAPYRQVMANILDIGDPNQIDLNDPTLRMAITDKGDMNLYDFKKALRQDERWQYTEQAKADVSATALGVLRDFGFQG